MDFKWLLILVLLLFAVVIYYNEELRGTGSAEGTTEGDLFEVRKTPRPAPGVNEPSTPRD
jgi:hypothetical protein